jgi:hypothetical protein
MNFDTREFITVKSGPSISNRTDQIKNTPFEEIFLLSRGYCFTLDAYGLVIRKESVWSVVDRVLTVHT